MLVAAQPEWPAATFAYQMISEGPLTVESSRDQWDSRDASDEIYQGKAHAHAKAFSDPKNVRRQDGTAILLRHGSETVAITARHCLWNRDVANARKDEIDLAFTNHSDIPLDDEALVLPRLSRVPSPDEIPATGGDDLELFTPAQLMAPYCGPAGEPGLYRHPVHDVALLRMSRMSPPFVEELRGVGHRPVSSARVDPRPVQLDDPVQVLGYPSLPIFRVPIERQPGLSHMFASEHAAKPEVSQGVVTTIEDGGFTVSVKSYKGSSGGPVVRHGRLVGMVVGFREVTVAPATLEAGDIRQREERSRAVDAWPILEALDWVTKMANGILG